jgi:DNA primase
MTEHHLKALARLSGHVRLSFDGDKAGIAATERAIPIAQYVGVDLTIISMPEGSKDPDELIKKDPDQWRSAVESAEPAVDWIIKQYSHREDLSTAAGKRRFTTAALDMIRTLADPVEQEHYIGLVSKMSDSSQDALKEKLNSKHTEPEIVHKKVVRSVKSVADSESYQDNLLAVALIDIATHDLFQSVNIATFSGENRQAVVKYLIDHGGKIVRDTPEELQKYDTYVKILLLKADARYADWNDQDRYFETARLLRQVANEYRKKQKEILTDQLRDAETLGDDIKANAARAELNKLIKEIQSGQR